MRLFSRRLLAWMNRYTFLIFSMTMGNLSHGLKHQLSLACIIISGGFKSSMPFLPSGRTLLKAPFLAVKHAVWCNTLIRGIKWFQSTCLVLGFSMMYLLMPNLPGPPRRNILTDYLGLTCCGTRYTSCPTLYLVTHVFVFFSSKWHTILCF